MKKSELLEALIGLGDGIHNVFDNKNRLYQGIVKNKKVIFYVTSCGSVYQNINQDEFKEIGQLCGVNDFKVIAEFNKWI